MNDRYVVSLEYAIKLCELGVKGKSEFYWVNYFKGEGFHIISCFDVLNSQEIINKFPAYLTDEIMEMLDCKTDVNIKKINKHYYCCCNITDEVIGRAMNLKDSLSGLLVALLERKLISAEQINK